MYRSDNGGTSFTKKSGYGIPDGPHVDYHGFGTDPLTAGVIYALTDGGIYRSSNRGDNWSFIGSGLANVEFYDIATSPADPNVVIGGTQDNGTLRYNGSSTVWEWIRGGDGGSAAIDPGNPNIVYSMEQYQTSLARSENGGAWRCIACGLPPEIACANFSDNFDLQVHPTTPSILLVSCSSLWRANNPVCTSCPNPPGSPGSPLAWTSILTPASGSVVRSAVDPFVNLYYAGSDDGRLYAGPSGANWNTVFIHPFGARITDIEFDPEDPSIVYASFGTSIGARVYQLRRFSPAPTSMVAVDITGDFPPNLYVRTLAVDRLSPFTLYAGIDRGGVYRGRSFDGGVSWTWTTYNSGLPGGLRVLDLDVHPATGVMRAGTYGRGAYEMRLEFPVGSPSPLAAEGRITLLRTHDVGTGYGRPLDQLDVEVIVQLDTHPGRGFGFQLREGTNEDAHYGMLKVLRDAFRRNRPVRLEYIRTGLHNGRILRVNENP